MHQADGLHRLRFAIERTVYPAHTTLQEDAIRLRVVEIALSQARVSIQSAYTSYPSPVLYKKVEALLPVRMRVKNVLMATLSDPCQPARTCSIYP